MTYELSIGIQKSIDFDGFLDEVDFVRLFSEKYNYYSHPTISHKPLRFCHSLSNLCLPSFFHVLLSSHSFSLLQKSLITYDFLSFAFFFLPNSCFLIDNFFSSICWLFVWIIFFFFCSFRWIFPTIHLFLGKNPLLFFFLFTICYFF